MMKKQSASRRAAWALGVAGTVWMGAVLVVSGAGAPSAAGRLSGSGQDDRATKAFNKVCSDCHEPDRIVESHRTRGGWEEILEKMIEKGATGTDQDFDLVLQYLLSHYGMVNMNQAPPEDIALIVGLTSKEADAIVAYRRANGNFKNFDGLAKVEGVDQKKLADHKDYILF
jgi:competence ComEA-like helix-hairpin-helix protein